MESFVVPNFRLFSYQQVLGSLKKKIFSHLCSHFYSPLNTFNINLFHTCSSSLSKKIIGQLLRSGGIWCFLLLNICISWNSPKRILWKFSIFIEFCNAFEKRQISEAEINVSEGRSLRTGKCTLLFINDPEKEMNSEKTKFCRWFKIIWDNQI